jgi:hypothetical protein
VRRWRARHLALLNLRGARARLIEITLIETPVVVALAALLVARTVIAALGCRRRCSMSPCSWRRR